MVNFTIGSCFVLVLLYICSALTYLNYMSKPIIIAFATQKGGAGKSTVGVHVASALHYLYGYRVAMLDCDYPQNTLYVYRATELGQTKVDENLRQRLSQQGIVPYKVVISSVDKAPASLDELIAADPTLDFILVDTPGTINVTGLPELLARVNYIFMPIQPDMGALASTMAYMKVLTSFLHSSHPESAYQLVGFYAFWNMHLKSERQTNYEKVEQLFAQKQLPLLRSRVENLVGYRERRSTFFSLPEKELAKLGMGSLIMEILSIIAPSQAVTPSGAPIAVPFSSQAQLASPPAPAPSSSLAS